MDFSQMTYTECKLVFARMASMVARANSAQELSALLLADTQAPYHTFDATAYPTIMANVTDRLGILMYDEMDDGEEVPA